MPVLHAGERLQRDRARGVAEQLVRMHAGPLQHRQKQVVHRRVLRVPQDLAALDAARAADQDERQVDVRVLVRVADAAAVEHERVVQQVAVAVGGRLQRLEEVGGQADVVLVDLVALLELQRVVLVVRHRVVGAVDAQLRIGTVGLLLAERQHENARDVRPERQRHQVEHQPGVRVVRFRRPDRPVGKIQHRLALLALGHLQPALDLAHGVEVLVHAAAVRRAELLLQMRDVGRHPVENAAVLLHLRSAFLRRAAVAEHPLEDDARVRLVRVRGGRGAPRDAVGVDAAIAVVAVADEVGLLHRQLERPQRRVAADVLRGDLVRRDAVANVGALGTAYDASRRRREIGVRVALGEPRGRILRRVLRDATRSCVIGVAVGLAVAVPLAHFLARLLVDVHPNDVIVFGGVAVLLMAIAGCAACVPAHRAARVDPMTTLRAE